MTKTKKVGALVTRRYKYESKSSLKISFSTFHISNTMEKHSIKTAYIMTLFMVLIPYGAGADLDNTIPFQCHRI